MTDHSDDNDNQKKNKPSRDYDVGYGKPPKHSQFKPGQSGNKKGRPKGAKNKPKSMSISRLSDLILKEGSHLITLREGEEVFETPKIEAVLKSLSMNAIKGDHPSQKLFLGLYRETEAAMMEKEDRECEDLIIYKRDWTEKIEYAERAGLPIPDPIPHPEHIIIDLRNGIIDIIGPMSTEEKKDWDLQVVRKLQWKEDLERMERELVNIESPEHIVRKQKLIAQLRRIIKLAQMQIPDDIYIPHSTKEFIKSSLELGFD